MQAILFFGVFLVVLLAFLIVIYFKMQQKKQANSKEKKVKVELATLCTTIKDKSISSQKLQSTLDMILQEYGEIKDISIYIDILLRITNHPQTNKNIIISFDKALSKRNPKYKQEISQAVTDGLNART